MKEDSFFCILAVSRNQMKFFQDLVLRREKIKGQWSGQSTGPAEGHGGDLRREPIAVRDSLVHFLWASPFAVSVALQRSENR